METEQDPEVRGPEQEREEDRAEVKAVVEGGLVPADLVSARVAEKRLHTGRGRLALKLNAPDAEHQ